MVRAGTLPRPPGPAAAQAPSTGLHTIRHGLRGSSAGSPIVSSGAWRLRRTGPLDRRGFRG